jgi:hypothetical protein
VSLYNQNQYTALYWMRGLGWQQLSDLYPTQPEAYAALMELARGSKDILGTHVAAHYIPTFEDFEEVKKQEAEAKERADEATRSARRLADLIDNLPTRLLGLEKWIRRMEARLGGFAEEPPEGAIAPDAPGEPEPGSERGPF